MTTSPQSPPEVLVSSPSRPSVRPGKKWKWLGGIGLFLVLLLALMPVFVRKRTICDVTEEVNNARQIGLALLEFEAEYGRFPDAMTIIAVQKETGTLLPLGTKTSNDYFRQLVGSGIAQSESMFYCRIKDSRKPDGVMDPAHALAKGEVGFAYLSGLSVEGNPSRPIIIAPLIPGTDRFDPKPFKGKAVMLKMDNSVATLPIQKDGHVLSLDQNILDPAHPVWGGKPPVIVWPE